MSKRRKTFSGSGALETSYIAVENGTSIPATSFTGIYDYIVQYGQIKCSGNSNVNGTIYFDFSQDGSTTAISISNAVTGGVGFYFLSPMEGQYVRVRWVSSGGLPSTLLVYTVYMRALYSSGSGGGSVVTSVFGRTGAIAATLGDYSFSLLSGTAAPTQGGTGLTTYTTGDLLYSSATNTLAKRAIGSSNQALVVSGGLPTWAAVANSVFGRTGTVVAATNDYSFSQISGTAAATQGGTAQTTYTTGDMLYASATDTLSKRAIGTTNQVLAVVGGVPTWTTLSGISSQTQVFTTGYSSDAGTNGTYYTPINYQRVGTQTPDTTIEFNQCIMPIAGTFKNAYVLHGSVMSSGRTRTYVLMKNGVAQSITMTVAGTSIAFAQDTTNTVTVVAGDVVCWRYIHSGGTFSSWTIYISVGFTPS